MNKQIQLLIESAEMWLERKYIDDSIDPCVVFIMIELFFLVLVIALLLEKLALCGVFDAI